MILRPGIRHVAVTGAGGFVGSELVTALIEKGALVTALVRNSLKLPGVFLFKVSDLARTEGLEDALSGCDAVVHLAARAHVMHEKVSDSLPLYRETNVQGTRRVAEASANAGVRRLVFLSSVKVDGERTSDRPFTPEDTPAPEDAYGLSKREAEEVLKEVSARTGLESVVIRSPLVYGPGVKGNFVRLLELVARGIPLPLASVDNRRSLIGLDNLVDFIVTCIQHPAAAGETFLVSDGEDLSTPELIRRIAAAIGRPARLWPCPPKLLEAAARAAGRSSMVDRLCGSLRVDSSKARERLGWAPRITVDEGLRRTVEWFLRERARAGG